MNSIRRTQPLYLLWSLMGLHIKSSKFKVGYALFALSSTVISVAKTGKIGLNSKEMTGLFRITALFRDLLKFAGNFVGDGLQRKTALAIIQSLLNYGNHHLVRIEGFRLLLLLMNSLSKESLDFIDMYQNAISINQVEGVEQSGSDIMTFFKTENGNALYAITFFIYNTSTVY